MKWRSLAEAAPHTDARPLREILAERKQRIAQYVPAETQAAHARVVEDLRRQQIAERTLTVGAIAPAVELSDQNGKPVRSAELLSKKHLVITFFRGRWCPFCVGQMEAMNQALPQIHDAGASFVAISPQTVHQSFLMADQHQLRFPLLSDAGNAIARAFGLTYRVPDEQQQLYRRTFVNLPFVNGDPSWELPIPATYIIDQDRTISWAAIDPDYTNRPEPAEVLRRLL